MISTGPCCLYWASGPNPHQMAPTWYKVRPPSCQLVYTPIDSLTFINYIAISPSNPEENNQTINRLGCLGGLTLYNPIYFHLAKHPAPGIPVPALVGQLEIRRQRSSEQHKSCRCRVPCRRWFSLWPTDRICRIPQEPGGNLWPH
jgi:hypothetical protein